MLNLLCQDVLESQKEEGRKDEAAENAQVIEPDKKAPQYPCC
jgi:hypothetical protein